jgi:molecular chaperone GrpE
MSKKNQKIADLENKWKKALADYENLQKRIEKERQDFIKFSSARILDKLLPVLDSLESCQGRLEGKGLELLLRQLREILESEGLKEIEAKGKIFDPLMMDAVEMGPGEKNKVIGVIMKGYELNGRVLRPAKVKVGAG